MATKIEVTEPKDCTKPRHVVLEMSVADAKALRDVLGLTPEAPTGKDPVQHIFDLLCMKLGHPS